MTEFERRLRDRFEENYEYLRGLSGGHLVTESVKDAAFLQVLYYLRRNRELIGRITHSEVKLNLPERRTPRSRYRYSIEGAVDIVGEEDGIWMYDIKTTDRKSVLDHLDLYRGQLSVYAYIWTKLHGDNLKGIAVVTTALPDELKDAINAHNPGRIERLLKQWDPVVPLVYSEKSIENFIDDFGSVVEDIEDGRFSASHGRHGSAFVVEVCLNCDARYSCDTYRAYRAELDGTKSASDPADDEFIEDNMKDSGWED
jgi:hypothetical protein